jgi:hypothetical protein
VRVTARFLQNRGLFWLPFYRGFAPRRARQGVEPVCIFNLVQIGPLGDIPEGENSFGSSIRIPRRR